VIFRRHLAFRFRAIVALIWTSSVSASIAPTPATRIGNSRPVRMLRRALTGRMGAQVARLA
jgi:hypothetical protein